MAREFHIDLDLNAHKVTDLAPGTAGTDAVNKDQLDAVGGSTILSGTAAPTSGIGDAGDYYLDTDDRVLYGPKIGASFGPPQTLLGSRTAPGQYGGAVRTAGMDILFAVAGRITGLRYYRMAGSSAGHTSTVLNVWHADGSLLGTATTSGEASGAGWRSATLSSPVTVVAGQTVRVGAYLTSTNYTGWENQGGSAITSGDLWNVGTGFENFSAHTRPTSAYVHALFVDVSSFEKELSDPWPVALYGTAGQSTILSGSATPNAGVGAGGDYYLDTDDRMLYGPKISGAGNLLTANQASVETDLTGWPANAQAGPSVGTVARSTAWAAHGSASALLTLVSNTEEVTYAFDAQSTLVVPGNTYTATTTLNKVGTWTRVGGPRTVIIWFNASDGVVAIVADETSITAWTSGVRTSTLTAVAPVGSAYARIYFFTGTGGNVNDAFYVDKVGFWAGSGTEWTMPGDPWPVALTPEVYSTTTAPASTGAAIIWVDSDDTSIVGSIPAVCWVRWTGTQAEYDALGTYNSNTLYVIV